MKDTFDILDDAVSEDGKWETVSSEYLFRRPWLTVRRDQVRLPDGRINPEFYVIEYPDWVNVIAITEDGRFVMERQFRHGLGKTCYEIPAGVIEEGETPLEGTGRRDRIRRRRMVACHDSFGELQHHKQYHSLLPCRRCQADNFPAS